MLHARSSQVVRVTVRPAMTTPYCCVISYHLVSSNQGKDNAMMPDLVFALLLSAVGGIAQW